MMSGRKAYPVVRPMSYVFLTELNGPKISVAHLCIFYSHGASLAIRLIFPVLLPYGRHECHSVTFSWVRCLPLQTATSCSLSPVEDR